MAASSSINDMLVATGAGRIACLSAGEGPVLLLLHGIGSGAQSWAHQLEELSGIRKVVAWNAPGYKGSEPLSAEAPDVQDYAQGVAALLTALQAQQCDLVGHSLGALIAARFACAFPERVRTLTLAGCAIGHARYEPAERERLLASRIGDVDQLGVRGMAEKRGPRLVSDDAPAQVRAQVVETMAQVDPHGYAQASRMLSKGDMLGDLERLPGDMPVQFIYGSRDVITPPDVNLRAAAMRPSAAVHVLEGAGHALYLEQAGPFNALVRQFIGAHDGSR